MVKVSIILQIKNLTVPNGLLNQPKCGAKVTLNQIKKISDLWI